MIAKRAYSTLEIKSVSGDQGKRLFTGIASTPSTDLGGDIVEPKGAVYTLPIPLLWMHDSENPIGWVTQAKTTGDGIEIVGEIADVPEDGPLKQCLLDAWQAIKAKLVRGLSIGFQPIEYSQIAETYGYRYTKWRWLELSACVIAMNTEASIQTVKSIDTKQRAASGKSLSRVVRLDTSPGVTGKTKTPVTPKGTDMKTIREQIDAFKAQRAQKAADMNAIMTKSGESGQTLDAADEQSYDTLKEEIETIDKHIVRLEAHEKTVVAAAVVVTAATQEQGTQQRGAIVTVKSLLPPGIEFARYAMCLASANGSRSEALQMAKARYPDNPRIHEVLKAAVDAGTTTDSTWAGPLAPYQIYAGDFVDFLRPQTILGKFGQGGIPALHGIPFNVSIGGQTSGGAGYWVGQGAPKPLTKIDFERTTFPITKVANIAVITEELARLSTPSAEMLVRNALAAALIERMDTDFIDPNKVAVSGVSPAGITNGVNPVHSNGVDFDSVVADVKDAMGGFIAANISPTTGVWIMSAITALSLSLMTTALGQLRFPTLSMNGGTFLGLPVIVSQYVPATTSGGLVVLVNATDIWLADDGQVVIDVSREASLQMLDNPTNDSASATATTMVSLWQTNSIGLRAERYINWKRRREAAVQYIDNVLWGQSVSS